MVLPVRLFPGDYESVILRFLSYRKPNPRRNVTPCALPSQEENIPQSSVFDFAEKSHRFLAVKVTRPGEKRRGAQASCRSIEGRINCDPYLVAWQNRIRVETGTYMRSKKTVTGLRAVEHVVDRRQNVRYDLAVPVTFVWKDQNGKRHREEGYTRDLSKEGAFVVANSCPPDGAYVQIELFLPPIRRGTNSVEMKGVARVTRVNAGGKEDSSGGFAILTQHFKLFTKAQREVDVAMQEKRKRPEESTSAG